MAEPAGVVDVEELHRRSQTVPIPEIAQLRRETEQAIFKLRHRMLQMFRLLSHEQSRVDELARELKRLRRGRKDRSGARTRTRRAGQGS